MYLFFVSIFHPLPTFTLSMTKHQVVRQHLPPEFYLRCSCFQTSHIWGTAALTCSDFLGESLTEQWLGASVPRNVCRTMLLPMPRDCGQVPAHPRKSLQDSVAAAFQWLWRITTYVWHQALPLMTLFQHQRKWPFSGVCWDQVASTVSTKCPSRSGTAFPMWSQNLPDPTLFLGIRPSHQSTTRYRAAELQPLRSPCLQS